MNPGESSGQTTGPSQTKNLESLEIAAYHHRLY